MVYELIYVIHGLEKIVLNDETIILVDYRMKLAT